MAVAAVEIGETLHSDELIGTADARLYEAKHAGRNLVLPAGTAGAALAVQTSPVKRGVE